MKISYKDGALILLSILVVVLFILTAMLWHSENNNKKLVAQEFNSLMQNSISASNSLSYQPVTVSPPNNKIYLPQLDLSIPLSTLGTSLVYSADTAYVTGSHKQPSGPFDEGSISTINAVGATQLQDQFNCSVLVRIKFEPKPDPYSPSEIPGGSVVLANGKTLQIYSEHQKACQSEWDHTGVNPDAIAALFKQAQSY